MNWDRALSNMKDYHVPVCLGMFGVGSVLQWFHHLDSAFVAFTATIIGGVLGHAYSPAQKDHDNDAQPK